ncbi:hypothetical protein ACE6H2_027160 [Prunus campanulata]
MQWKKDLIQNWLSPYEAELIYRLPLSFRCPPDRLIWHFDKKGFFSVRSAYQVARRLMLMEDEMASSSTESYGTKFWKHIWEANVPPKVRHFIWRVAQNILPTKDRLITRGVDGNLLGCVFCGKTEESAVHVLLFCPFAVSLWSASPMGLWFLDGAEPSLKCLLNRVFDTCSKSRVEQIMILCWALWNERNARVWSNEKHHPVEIASSAMNLLLEYHSLNFIAKPPSIRRHVRWHKPLPGIVKINVDGAFNPATGKGGVGIVIRDDQGGFLGGRARCFENVFSPAHVGALALLEGLAVVQTWLGIPVALESDSQALVLAVNGPNNDTSELGRFIDDARFLLARWDSCSLSHVLREGNKVAHCIARFALLTQQVCFWEQPPDFIQKDLLADLM